VFILMDDHVSREGEFLRQICGENVKYRAPRDSPKTLFIGFQGDDLGHPFQSYDFS
jgi:hypothetical protein